MIGPASVTKLSCYTRAVSGRHGTVAPQERLAAVEAIRDQLNETPPAADSFTYEDLFRRHFGQCVRLAALLGADDPQDVAQEAFVRLHKHLRRLDDDRAALAYVRRTTVNLAYSRLRHLRVVRRHLAGTSLVNLPSAEATAVLNDEKRRLLAALDRLTLRQRAVLVLRFWLDLPGPQIAAALDMAAGTVKSTTSRALQALAADLKDGS